MAGFPLDLTLGPIVIGAFFTVFFFGLICMQTISYLKKFPNDILLIKCTVIFLWVLQLAYTACICQGAYTLSVTDFGQIFALLYTPWGLNLGVVVGSLVDHGVQAFFVARIYKATGILSISIFLWLFVAMLQGISLMLAAEAIRTDSIPLVGQKWKSLITLLFFGDASLDIVNACVLGFYLKLKSRSARQSTAVVLDRLVVYTLQTGFGTSMVAFAAAISFKAAPEDYIWVLFFTMLPGSFQSALLANINHRKSISQPNSTVTSANSHGLGQGVVHFSRNIMISRDDIDPVNTVKSEVDDPNSSIEMNKVSSRSGIYGINAV